jgi:hypothetical protein
MIRRAAVILLLCFAMLAAGYLYTAHLAETGIKRGLVTWAQQRNADGWHVTGHIESSLLTLLGAEVVVRDGDLVIDNAMPGGLELGASRIVIKVSPFDPLDVRITVPDQALLRLGSQTPVHITSKLLEAVVRLQPKSIQPRSAIRSITIAGQKLAGDDGSAVGSFDTTVTIDPNDAKLDLRTEAIVLPVDVPVLGSHLSDFTLHAALDVFPGDVGSAASRADIWRSSGGKIAIDSIMAGWGPLGITGQGSMTLDSNLQPDGSATLQLRGYQQVLSLLGDQGQLASAMIAANGDKVEIRVKKNRLNVDRLTIMKLPKVEW